MNDETKQGRVYKKPVQQFKKQDISTDRVRAVEEYYHDPMGTKNYLGLTNDPNFMYRWVICNDKYREGRIQYFKRLGYTEVVGEDPSDSPDMGPSRMGSSTIIKDHKGGDQCILMKCPKDVWESNQIIKRRIQANKPLFDEAGKPIMQDVIENKSKFTVDPDTGAVNIYQKEQGSDIIIK